MKTWEKDHPKANLMARKRSDILTAARHSFLERGYEGTSMESVAKVANVSIMTLYRHAQTKEDLFSAVIANFCDSSDEPEESELELLLRKPLGDVLVATGIFVQESLSNPVTVALMRTVVAEATRFPHLARMAYDSLIGRLEEVIVYILGRKSETDNMDEKLRRSLATDFVDRLVGSDLLRLLLGLPGFSLDQQAIRARLAADELMLRVAVVHVDCAV